MNRSHALHNEAALRLRLQNESTRHEAFAELVQQHSERLYWHIRKMVLSHADADDVLQNTFIKAWEGMANFRGEAQLHTWLYRIATNESITFLNQSKRLLRLSAGDAEQLLANLRSTDSHFSASEVQAKLQAAILTLPPKQRLVFNMRYFDEMPYEQMSEVLETSVGALKASYHIAVQKIEKLL
ncbi:MAG: sigma-70 family RNA polymerase sigma factor [Prevotellaceae bacterium]|jgi:RNA polymerase sigma-70 factor (ECF subfamily)|nr:sigma-70 family RNA polymerase sigma factor [Prevotellaceae bacterium]